MQLYQNKEGQVTDENSNLVDMNGNPVEEPIYWKDVTANTETEGTVLAPNGGVEVDTEKEDEEMITISKSELDSILEEKVFAMLNKQLTGDKKPELESEYYKNSIREIMEGMRDSLQTDGSGGGLYGSTKRPEIPVEDMLEEPVTFYAYCHSTVIFDDYSKGRDINVPYGPIKFTHLLRRRISATGGKANGGTLAISAALIYTKRQLEFMRNHSLINVRFFEKMKDVLQIDTDFAQCLLDAASIIGDNDMKILQMCRSEGIAADPSDIRSTRTALIHAVAKRLEIERGSSKRSIVLRDDVELENFRGK